MQSKKNPERILIVTLSNVGDVYLTAPVVNAVWRAYPLAKMSLVVGVGAQEVFRDDPRLQEIIPYDKRSSFLEKCRLVASLRRKKFDLVIDLRNSLFPLLIGAPRQTSLLTQPPRDLSHRMDRHLWKLKEVGIATDGSQEKPLWVRPESEEKMRKVLRGFGVKMENPFVLVSAGSKSELKRWKAASFSKLCDRLHREKEFPLIFIGEEADKPFVKKVTSVMREPFHSLVGETSLPDLVALIRTARLLVTNDSASLHIASLLGTPTVAIFGPTDPKKYGPRSERHRVVRKDLFCAPCEKARCPYHHECMNELPVEEVYRACLDLLVS